MTIVVGYADPSSQTVLIGADHISPCGGRHFFTDKFMDIGPDWFGAGSGDGRVIQILRRNGPFVECADVNELVDYMRETMLKNNVSFNRNVGADTCEFESIFGNSKGELYYIDHSFCYIRISAGDFIACGSGEGAAYGAWFAEVSRLPDMGIMPLGMAEDILDVTIRAACYHVPGHCGIVDGKKLIRRGK